MQEANITTKEELIEADEALEVATTTVSKEEEWTLIIIVMKKQKSTFKLLNKRGRAYSAS